MGTVQLFEDNIRQAFLLLVRHIISPCLETYLHVHTPPHVQINLGEQNIAPVDRFYLPYTTCVKQVIFKGEHCILSQFFLPTSHNYSIFSF